MIREEAPCRKPKTGYWIEHFSKKSRLHIFECSRCYYWHDEKEKICPNCGAKMSEIPTSSESEE